MKQRQSKPFNVHGSDKIIYTLKYTGKNGCELHFYKFPLLSLLLCAKTALLSMKFIYILYKNITFITRKNYFFPKKDSLHQIVTILLFFYLPNLTCGTVSLYNKTMENGVKPCFLGKVSCPAV